MTSHTYQGNLGNKQKEQYDAFMKKQQSDKERQQRLDMMRQLQKEENAKKGFQVGVLGC